MFEKLSLRLPISERIQKLFRRNAEYTRQFRREMKKRADYAKEHPTAIFVFKCMDGRAHFPYVTNFPIGLIKPFRRLGGKFNLGWPHLGDVFFDSVNDQKKAGRSSLVICSYHFSKGDPKRGCAGFNYDTAAAISHQAWFKDQISQVFDPGTAYPIVVGLETDTDALILHGEEGRQMDLSARRGATEDEICAELAEMFPDMPAQMVLDLLPLVMGNLEHIKEIESQKRLPIEMEHNEWVIALGTGFDWLHAPNTVIIIGPWHLYEILEEIRVALRIIQGNIRDQRIPDDGFVFLISAEWSQAPEDRLRAEKVKVLSDAAKSVLSEPAFSDIADKAHFITAIVDESKKLSLLGDSKALYGELMRRTGQELDQA